MSDQEQPQEKTKEAKAPYKLAIVAPTCFYYQVPLFRALADDPRFDLTVYFCSGESLNGEDVLKTFNTVGHWGVEDDLLTGYKHIILRNFSPRGSYLKWPFGLMNFGIIKHILRARPDAVVLMSWTNITWWLAILACMVLRVPFLYMTDANVLSEQPKPWLHRRIKHLVLAKFVFRFTRGFLCAGTANRLLYQQYGVPEEKLVSFAYSWGYQPFLQGSKDIKERKKQLMAELGIPEDKWVILYCGRLSEEKSPGDLLEAYKLLKAPDKALAFVGDGELRQQLEEQVAEQNIESVYFFGFQNRHDIPKYYAIADTLVVPSRRETWGMVVNEAMCFSLPIIVSDQVGAGVDLVQDNYNGYTYPTGDIGLLCTRIEQLMNLPENERKKLEARSKEIVTEWSEKDLAQTLTQYLDRIIGTGDPRIPPDSVAAD